MKQLSGQDATFLYMETPTTFGHTSGLAIYTRPYDEFHPYETVYATLASLVGDIEPMRRRLVEVPFQLDHPYWIADPNFDIDYHVRELNLAQPGRVDQLADQVCRLMARPMDRTRPLWEVYVIDGLESGQWALLFKYHHATVDGGAGMLMLNMMLSTEPNATPRGGSTPWEPEPIPSGAELLRLTMVNLARNPVKSLLLQMRILRQLADTAGLTSVSAIAQQANVVIKAAASGGRSDRPKLRAPSGAAPPTPWNRTITPHRRFAMRTSSLENIKRLKQATGGTVNDVVMAICTGALRNYLLRHDALPEKPLRAMVPVSLRTGDESDPWTNRVSGLVVDLPTDHADPLERVRRCSEAMLAAKRQFELMPAEALSGLAQFSSPVLSTAASRLATQFRLADYVAAPVNLVISNVPGPRQPLYFGEAELQHQFPVSIVTDGQGLNVTVTSYLDRLDFGLVADRDLIPDLWDLADLHIAEIEGLFEATGAEWAEPPRPAAPRTNRASLNKAVAKKAAVKKAVTKKAVTKKAVTKKAATTKAPTKKAATKKAAVKKPAV